LPICTDDGAARRESPRDSVRPPLARVVCRASKDPIALFHGEAFG